VVQCYTPRRETTEHRGQTAVAAPACDGRFAPRQAQLPPPPHTGIASDALQEIAQASGPAGIENQRL
jgi:hypothetical protein